MNFDKKTLSKKVGRILEENVQSQEEKEDVRKIMQGRKLAYHAANRLILTLITAMIMGDGEDEEEGDEFQGAGEEQTKSQTQTLNEEGHSQTQTQTQSSQEETTQNQAKLDLTKVCKFYRNGNCKFGTKCHQEHPKFCRRFTKHGLQRHNPSGCDSKCGKLHPNACRSSLRTKECERENCRFYHIRGTVNTFKQIPEGGWGNREKELWREESRKQESRTTNRPENKEEMRTKDQVFLESQQAMIQMLAKLSEKLDAQMEGMKERSTQQNQPFKTFRMRTDPQQWRTHQREDQWLSQ